MEKTTRNYRITANGYSEIVQSDKVEFMPNTGQTLFYLEGVLLHIAPSSALVTDTTEQDLIMSMHDSLLYFIRKEKDSMEEFWKSFLQRNKTYDATEVSEEDKIGRVTNREKSIFLSKLEEKISKSY